jgi:impB/mucB/samB family C-terminal domain
MHACVETTALRSVSQTPAWAIRVPRPAGDGFRMTARLQGVPKPMLQTVFGKALGLRIWEQARWECVHPADRPTNQVADSEISTGMVNYVSLQAVATLRECSRQAKAIRLTVTSENGESCAAQMRLATPTSEINELAEAATELLRRFPVRGVQSVDLAVTTVKAAAIQEQTPALVYSMAST